MIVVSIAATGTTDRAFSADTGMAEVLVIATRTDGIEQTGRSVLFVNLLRRPQSILEATTIARVIQRMPADQSIGSITIGSGERAGCSIRGTLSDAGCAGLRDPSVAKAAAGLVQGKLRLPRQQESMGFPVTRLGQLGLRGLVDRDINGAESTRENLPRGPFDIVGLEPEDVPTWPALWAHKAAHETQMVVMPDRAAEVRPACEDHAVDTWQRTASRLHFNRDFQINSQPLAACLTPELSIGGTAWPNFLCDDRRWERPLVLWANTTLGLISFWWIGTRQQQGRARLTISKLPSLTVIDPRRFTASQLDYCDEIFEGFRDRRMLPANEACRTKCGKHSTALS